MDLLEPLTGISTDEETQAIEGVAAVGDFHFASRAGRLDAGPVRLRRFARRPDDSVALSDIANVSLREEEGMSASAIAADLGLSAETVLMDMEIAAEIAHPAKS